MRDRVTLPPAPDLKAMTIYDLMCLSETFNHLSDAALGFLDQQRMQESLAGEFLDALWDRYFNGLITDIAEEMKTRTPASSNEAEWKANVIIQNSGDDFRTKLSAAVDYLQFRDTKAA
ncbi:hypothetical protein [Aestuariivirga sp.]|uniref:hypothetical protein n=1 Tax=Aestuariivirga sp. TaxID=2650926 RepID=UPI0039195936